MKVKIFRRNTVEVNVPEDYIGVISPYRDENNKEYQARINEFISSVNVLSITPETNGGFDENGGTITTNLIIMYEEK
ncbi:hypothetical protein ACMGE9_02595 [Macrococcus sp. EM39E]|uniref:hypothetical protein n=1 Tax=Macrococcus animalis TaxID=3395467 RepID=UPI0039BEBE84